MSMELEVATRRSIGLKLTALRPIWNRIRRPGLAVVSEFLVIAGMLLTMRLAAFAWGTAGLGEYVNARRTLGLLQLPLLCGVILGLSRSVAMARAQGTPRAEQHLLTAAFGIVALTSVLGLGIVGTFSTQFTQLFFGGTSDVATLQAVLWCLPGLLLHGVIYGWFCGRRETVAACAWHVLNHGLLPTVLCLFCTHSVRQYFVALAWGWGLTSGFGCIGLAAHERLHRISFDRWRAAAIQLLRFGVPRVPADLLLGAYLALPTLLTTHLAATTADVREQVAFVGIGVSLTTMLGSLFAPLGPLTLPAASASLVAGRTDELRSRLVVLTLFAFGASLILVTFLEVIAPWLIAWYFGEQFRPAVSQVRITILGAIPYCLYIVLRSMLDALREFPLNGKNILLATVSLLVIGIAVKSSQLIPVAFCASLFVLGTATVIDGWKLTLRVVGCPRKF